MDRDATQLYCPNSSCQAPNAERSKFCQRCRTLLPKRYLWAIEPGHVSIDPLPEILDERYVLKYDRVYLDTHPGLLPHVPEKVPPEIRAYLRLFPYRWHVPQIYGSARRSEDDPESIWLLENAPIEPRPNGTWRPFPHIDLAWSQVDALHKLGWLWQILNLWTDCVREGVASTLLDPLHVRVNGSFIRLDQLIADDTELPPGLDKLGRLWSRWIAKTEPPLHDFFDQLCHHMIEGQLHTPEQAQIVIDRAIDRLKVTRNYHWQVTTLSDRGPSRTRNEDACFPLTEKPEPPRSQVLGIVCDGVGGHDGGDIASGLAISTLSHRVSTFETQSLGISRADKLEYVREAIAEANDAIGQRNNEEQRQGRQRMGTTIVIGQGDDNDLFISHVGDSRAYLVNSRAFYSLTVDDDVASREVRLGYAFYRSAVHQPAAGSLVQALGMGASSHLYPTTQRFILNEDCVVLLCSDGLSDYDRVEQHWKTELQPILENATSLTSAAHRLVEIANTQNGHDNVTVALMQLRVTQNPTVEVDAAELAACLRPLPHDATHPDRTTATIAATVETTVAPRHRSRLWPILAISIPIVLLAGLLLPRAIQRLTDPGELEIDSGDALPPPVLESDTAEIQLEDRTSLDRQNPAVTANLGLQLAVGQSVRVFRPLTVYSEKLETSPSLEMAIEAGEIVEVKAIAKTVDHHWLQVQSCSTDRSERAAPVGWVDIQELTVAGYELYKPEPGQAGVCDTPEP